MTSISIPIENKRKSKIKILYVQLDKMEYQLLFVCFVLD